MKNIMNLINQLPFLNFSGDDWETPVCYLNRHRTLVAALIMTPLLLPAVQSALTLLPTVQNVVINQLPAVQ